MEIKYLRIYNLLTKLRNLLILQSGLSLQNVSNGPFNHVIYREKYESLDEVMS